MRLKLILSPADTIWLWCVENYGNPAILVKSPWSFTIEPAMTGELQSVAH